jgi:membrane-bound ClpP family serine protease
MELSIDQTIKASLDSKLADLEKNLKADVLGFQGPIQEGIEQIFLNFAELLERDPHKKDILYIILTTPGGSATAVERCVNIIRHHYKEVNFIVPNYAYSAGTIFCMSGDSIYMDYFSVLGPIDPQVFNKSKGILVPALGYLDKVNELIKKSQKDQLSQAEFIILKEFDLAELRSYEQAKELTIDQLKKWLVKYKFKNWQKHKSGKIVTHSEKVKRAKEIADKLSDSNIWKSHSRPINIEILENELKLKIEDFGKNKELSNLIRSYDSFINDYFNKIAFQYLVHTRRCLWHA